MSIAQRECDETLYWMEIIYELQELSYEEFNRLILQAQEILKMLKSIVLTMQAKLKKNERGVVETSHQRGSTSK
jgi:hypothetical protein